MRNLIAEAFHIKNWSLAFLYSHSLSFLVSERVYLYFSLRGFQGKDANKSHLKVRMRLCLTLSDRNKTLNSS